MGTSWHRGFDRVYWLTISHRYGYNRYVIFFQRNFSWILIVFVFFSLVLSAMQVGAGLKELEDNYAFLRASYVFVVFSMVRIRSSMIHKRK
jgi:hypothetical protein